MISGWTEDHEELRDLTRRFLTDKSSSEAVRALFEHDAVRDDVIWTQMAEQLGLQGLAIPEEHGGAGLGAVELGVVCEEMGRRLLVAPYFSTVVLAAQTLTSCSDDAAQAAYLPGIAAGTLTATLAVADATGSFELDQVITAATAVGEDWSLSGTKKFVVDGDSADLLLVAAKVDEGLGLFAVKGDAEGVTRTLTPNLDLTRRLATVVLDGAAATRIGGEATATLSRTADLVWAALAAEQVGGASAALEMAVDYAKLRVQFDRPIGSFQAIKHALANLKIDVESGRSAAFFAAALLDDESTEGPVAASVAKAWCSTAYTATTKQNIQVHGGIGFTWEADPHLFLKRAKASESLFGSPAWHRRRIAELTGINDGATDATGAA